MLLFYRNRKINGAYFKGFMVGDGTTANGNRPVLYLYEPKYMCKERLINSLSEIEGIKYWNTDILDISFADCSPSNQNRQTMNGLSCRVPSCKIKLW